MVEKVSSVKYRDPVQVTQAIRCLVDELERLSDGEIATSLDTPDSWCRVQARASLALSRCCERNTGGGLTDPAEGAEQGDWSERCLVQAYVDSARLHWDASDPQTMLKAYRCLMGGTCGSGGVASRSGVRVLRTLFDWYNESPLHPLIKSAVFHYELTQYHPFSDGNGRLARLWQRLLLAQWRGVFRIVPMEEELLSRYAEYRKSLAMSDCRGECAAELLEVLLQVWLVSLRQLHSQMARGVAPGEASMDKSVAQGCSPTHVPASKGAGARPVESAPVGNQPTETPEVAPVANQPVELPEAEARPNEVALANPGSGEAPGAATIVGRGANRSVVRQKKVASRSSSDGPECVKLSAVRQQKVDKLLEVLGSDTVTAAVLMERTGLKHKDCFRKSYLHPALQAGLIERTVPEKPNCRYQKYRRSH